MIIYIEKSPDKRMTYLYTNGYMFSIDKKLKTIDKHESFDNAFQFLAHEAPFGHHGQMIFVSNLEEYLDSFRCGRKF